MRADQGLLGGRYGEMSTLMNDTHQSLTFCGKAKLKLHYDLVANIGSEDLCHIEGGGNDTRTALTGRCRAVRRQISRRKCSRLPPASR